MSIDGPLGDRSRKELAELARKRGVHGWETMRKDELVKALSAKAKPTAKPVRASKPALRPLPIRKPIAKAAAKVTKPAKPAVNGTVRLPQAAPSRPARSVASKSASGSKSLPLSVPSLGNKDLSAANAKPTNGVPIKDRILLMVPDAFWLHASWELSSQSVQRAEAALRQDWHGAKPIIRLFDVTSQDTTSTSETPVRDVVIHGGCSNWYIDIQQPPRSYRADIGYISRRNEFFVLARSNVVTPPKAGSSEAIEEAWNEYDGNKKGERLLAMSTGFETADGDPELKKYLEEKLKRPIGAPKDTAYGGGAMASKKTFFFDLDAKLIVFGKTDPMAHLTLQNEPIKLAADGSFVMWFGLPDSRQIIPAVATSGDGAEERTIVLAIERNTKRLDPMIHDLMAE